MKESWHPCRIVSFLVLLHYVVCFLMCLFLKLCQCKYRISQYYSYKKNAIFGVDHRSIQRTEGGITQLFICTQLFTSWGPGILTTYSTGMVNIFLSLETQTICLLTLDECIFSPLFASTSISTVDREVELNNSIPRRAVTPFFLFLSSSWIHFILHLQEK